MIQKLKQVLLTLTAGTLLLAPALVPVAVHADAISDGLNCGANFVVVEGTCTPVSATDTGTRIQNIITTVINLFSLLVGVVAVIMIIVGGLKYITSGGDSGNVTGAKNTILYAIVGLIVVALAQFIVKFILGRTVDTNATSGALFLFL